MEESCTVAGAYYYAAWNMCIAEILRRESYAVYHAADYHGALAPLYLLPDTATKRTERPDHTRVVMVLTLHNAEYQGVFEFPDDDDGDGGMEQVTSVKAPKRNGGALQRLLRIFRLSPLVYTQYVAHSGVFNMLAAGSQVE